MAVGGLPVMGAVFLVTVLKIDGDKFNLSRASVANELALAMDRCLERFLDGCDGLACC